MSYCLPDIIWRLKRGATTDTESYATVRYDTKKTVLNKGPMAL